MPRIGATLGVLVTIAFCIGFNISRYPKVWDAIADMPGQRGSEQTPRPSTPVAPTDASTASSNATPTAPAPSAKSAAVEKPPLQIAQVAEKYALNAAPSDKKANARTKRDSHPPKTKNLSQSPSGDSRHRSVQGSSGTGSKPKTSLKPPKIAATRASHGDVEPAKPTAPAAESRSESTAGKHADPAPPGDAPPPLVPVAPGMAGQDLAAVANRGFARSPLGAPDDASGMHIIRRLPPVDPAEPHKSWPRVSALGPIPFYPTTGVN
jgi:hypothetical protein